MSSVLYITYDGLMEPLGQSQVLAYVAQLARSHRMHVLSFEKRKDRSNKQAMDAMRSRLRDLGIGWTAATYHKRPSAPATAFDIATGMVVGTFLGIRNRVDIVHARSYVAAAMALPICRLTSSRFLFDMRGFWADERVDGALWPRDGWLYRVTKALEDRFLRSSDHIVTLTAASAKELTQFKALSQQSKPITVIPTCADLQRFCPPGDRDTTEFVFGYVGSIGTWYLFNETLAFFKALLARRPQARFLVVNRNEHDLIRALADKAGIASDRLQLVAAAHSEVPRFIQQMHLGSALIRPSYSKLASAPTKLAEYLGCGVPCLGNEGVGDVAQTLRERNIGTVLTRFDPQAIDESVDQALALCADPSLPQRCVEAARDLYSLEHGVNSYERIYQSLALPVHNLGAT